MIKLYKKFAALPRSRKAIYLSQFWLFIGAYIYFFADKNIAWFLPGIGYYVKFIVFYFIEKTHNNNLKPNESKI